MSDIESANFSETAASNNAASPNGAPEGMAPSGVNDTIREVMAAEKREWNRSHPTLTSGGSANVQTLTYTTAPAGYVQGQRYSFIAGFSNSGATTLNVNGLGALAVTKNGATALAGGEIAAGAVVTVMYDGTQFQLTDGVLGALTDPATLTSTDASATAGPTLNLDRNSASPAPADLLGILRMLGRNASAAVKTYAAAFGFITDPTAGSEDGGYGIQTILNGTVADRLYVIQGVYTPNAAGGDKGINTINATTLYQAGAPVVFGFRNQLLNSAMGVAQRGAGGSASFAVAASTTAYTLDRWYLSTLTGQASTVAQTAITTLAGTRYAARVQRNSGQTGTGVMVFAQPLDSDVIATLVGQTCVLSAQVSTGANWSPASGTLSYKVYCGTGSVGKRNASAYTSETAPISGSTNIAAGTAVGPITAATGTIPAGTTQMEVQFFWTPVGTAGANDWFQITNIQLEVGSVATPFDASRQNFVAELAQCQRFYEKSFPYTTAPVQNVGNQTGAVAYTYTSNISQVWDITIYWKATKRVAPNITSYNPGAANANWRNVGSSSDIVFSTTTIGDSSAIFHAASTTTNATHYVHFAADAEI